MQRNAGARRRLNGPWFAGVALLTLGLSGCAFPPGVCPAIGYLSSLDVLVEGARAVEVVALEICTDAGCVSSSAESPPTTGPLITVSEERDRHWRVLLDLDAPDAVRVEAFAADGTSLASTDAQLEWRRTGGSAACGGPRETDPITLHVG